MSTQSRIRPAQTASSGGSPACSNGALPLGGLRRSRSLLVGPLLWLLLVLASSVSAEGWDCHSEAVQAAHGAPGSVFESVEAAVVDALAHAQATTRARDRGRLRLGTIYRVPGGFSYRAPERSEATVWASRPPVLRYALRPTDVASYIVHPRSGRRAVDQANEHPSASERRIVDELDPDARALYLLTPSLRVVRYANQRETEVATLPPRSVDRTEPVAVAAR